MTDRQIPFSAPMVRALLDGRKTQTRRLLKHPSGIDISIAHTVRTDHPIWIAFDHPKGGPLSCVKWPYASGDRLYVREAWRAMDGQDHFSGAQIKAQCLEAGYKRPWSPIRYEADGAQVNWIADPHTFGTKAGRYRHARFMPRWASRLTLTVTDVRVQRLCEISEADARAEGLATVTKDGNLWKWGIADRDGLPGNDNHGWHWKEWEVDPRAAFKTLWNSIHGPEAWTANPWVVAVSFTVQRGNIDQIGGTS